MLDLKECSNYPGLFLELVLLIRFSLVFLKCLQASGGVGGVVHEVVVELCCDLRKLG